MHSTVKLIGNLCSYESEECQNVSLHLSAASMDNCFGLDVFLFVVTVPQCFF